MTIMTRLMGTAALGLALGLTTLPAMAATPDNMLVIANRIDDITTLDPAQSFEFAGSDVLRNVYGKLVNFDPENLDAGYQPDLAESWTVSEDGRTITFTMREGVKFQSGNPVRAEDVAFSLKRVVLLDKTPSFIITQFGFTPENIDETIKVDGNTVSITTDKRYATSFVLNCLTATIGAIVDEKTVMANEVDGDMGNTWLATNSAGSGPYILTSWKPKESVTLTANPDFYGGEPAMKRVIVRHVQESATQRLMLERGDIDVARNLNPSDVEGVRAADGVEILEEMRGRLMYISMNQKHPELSKPEVRQALKYLIDYKGMESSFLKGAYVVHQNFLPKTYLGSVNENPFSLDLDKAKALLAEAGVDGMELTVGVREAQERLEIGQSLQNTFAQAGITLNLEVGTGKQVLGKYRARELDIYLGAWGPDYPDPHTNAGTFAYNPDNSDEANATGLLAWRNAWDTAGLTEKTAAAVVEGDTEKRAEMYHEIQAEFRDKSPFAVMFQKVEQAGVAENVEGLSLGGAITAVSYWSVTK
ncbi:ABC transporter substrate-binding protein [Phaeobacter gallaeciensis]|uniref:ABC transporter substrate-binding protein n=1 Tax=Phaeobacter gallaeciensis TaxID=60890 RepID=UPI00237F2E06|nr:ABC transporter substrate-binding protein [Phaeobacter gallaeciensis]MDE4096560.1 ABC transporter substrate-binding protein [Phaeobacter gallaeciensis]MDE4105371.1 ABC transporter substrate-binding protein [Phaeobacter gallaeciensis]MDE4109827.1 ABC transporter substrate-binding protein [Phaeobacter gallaeciensis]MDE4114295.1 ABC transporter substrate-binding protein [Phaeobacter gallaeciensis]MDE4118762.1 ABC transporter substrate-binding protein [Phaeobacter gallaeciensis]